MRASRMRAYRRRAYRRRAYRRRAYRRRACRRRTRLRPAHATRPARHPRRGDGCVPCGVRGACASVLRRQSAGFRVMGLRRDGGRAAGLRQRLADRVRDEAVHGAAVAEAHLMLGGMDVDVHRGGIDVQEQHIGRLAVAMQHVGVGGAQRVADRAVAHETAVDVQVLPVDSARAAVGRVIMPARLTVPTACDSSRPCSANSAPSTSRMRCGGSAGSHWRCARSWWNRRNAMCGCASAMRSIASTQCPNSVASERRNLRRAGTASNSWRTSTVVPGGPEAG